MSNCRFMYASLVDDPSRITLSSARPGLVGMPAPRARGTAVAYAAGEHTGPLDQLFLVEIDSTAAGSEVGRATFRWRRADRDSWEASGVGTSEGFVDLADGVRLKWSSGPGQDFFTGDAWTILATRSFAAAALVDRDRDTQWEATGCAEESITLDLGRASEVQALVLADHNLGPGAQATLMADDAADWDSPAYRQDLPVTSPHLVYFLEPAPSHRHWRLRLRDAANPGGALSAGLLYLGSFFEPSRNFSTRWSRGLGALRTTNTTSAGKLTGDTRGIFRSFSLSFQGITPADVAGFEAMFQEVHQAGSGRLSPIFFTPDPGRPGETIYCLPPQSLGLRQLHQGRYSLELGLEEVVRSHV